VQREQGSPGAKVEHRRVDARHARQARRRIALPQQVGQGAQVPRAELFRWGKERAVLVGAVQRRPRLLWCACRLSPLPKLPRRHLQGAALSGEWRTANLTHRTSARLPGEARKAEPRSLLVCHAEASRAATDVLCNG